MMIYALSGRIPSPDITVYLDSQIVTVCHPGGDASRVYSSMPLFLICGSLIALPSCPFPQIALACRSCTVKSHNTFRI